MADNKKVEKKSGGIAKWFREMKSELKKVVWPTWNTVVKNTGIVIAMIIIVGVFLGIIDAVFKPGIGALININL